MIWLLGIIGVGMAWRFTEALTQSKWSAIWYGIEILALGLFIKGLMI